MDTASLGLLPSSRPATCIVKAHSSKNQYCLCATRDAAITCWILTNTEGFILLERDRDAIISHAGKHHAHHVIIHLIHHPSSMIRLAPATDDSRRTSIQDNLICVASTCRQHDMHICNGSGSMHACVLQRFCHSANTSAVRSPSLVFSLDENGLDP
jgi:hypothetical protein